MLVNSRKVGYRGWTTGLALLAVLALASCGKKPAEPTANNSPSEPTAAQSSAPAAATTPSKESTTTTSSTQSTKTTTTASSKPSKSASSTLSPDAEKLGVKPTGTDCPSNAPIKGNVNKKGNKIYHEAKEANYKQVKPEICFADAATAQKAGFRAPKGAK